MRRARLQCCLAALAWGASAAAPAFELSADMPPRQPGLWLMEQTGTISDGKTTFEIQKVWRVCLDGEADRALHELEVREQQASVAGLNERCDEPKAVFKDGRLSWSMYCSGPSPIEDKIGKTDVRHATTFVGSDETQSETVVVNRDNLIRSKGRFDTVMKRLGACEEGKKAGDMLMMHWRVNGEETLKARQFRNVFEELENSKTFTASRLNR
ncbi:DUF3617 domain-containing protein [Pusillimonas noertemannii]|uniref:DUF3617 domain-containing protein n=1 Tax=Pusillimonas noertemannii TaxID=305977 RepID=UPI00036371EC|nr:DUF3617 family protein [Pusillimonas noertemannii]